MNYKKFHLKSKKFHRLTVLDEDVGRNHNKLVMSLCKCDCGNIKEIPRCHVISGHIKSCGCLNYESSSQRINLLRDNFYKDYDYTDGKLGQVYQYYKRNAKRRGIEFNISRCDFLSILKRKCLYCGEPYSMSQKSPNGIINYNGVDRIDSSLGYSKENLAPCCKQCNSSKGSLTVSEFYDYINRVYTQIKLNENERRS